MGNRYLFRGKRKDNGEWVFGDLVHSVYKIGDTCVGQYGNEVGMHEVDPETVCQCTGLKDKNGKLIWENDIIKCYADTNDLGNDLFFWYEVLWHENYHCWWLSEINIEEGEYLHEFYSNDIEVIGTKFDNPELLEKENREDSCGRK